MTIGWIIMTMCFWTVNRAESVQISAATFLPSKLFYLGATSIIAQQQHDSGSYIWRSADSGKSWAKLDNFHERISCIIAHPYDQTSTQDSGATWSVFETPIIPSLWCTYSLSFNPLKPDYILFLGYHCHIDRGGCREDSFYTRDRFKSIAVSLLQWTDFCMWGNNGALDRVYCIQWPDDLQKGDIADIDPSKLRLVYSDDFFSLNIRHHVDFGGAINGFIRVGNWLLTASPSASGGVTLFSQRNGYSNFSEVTMGDQGFGKSVLFTVMESSDNSIAVDTLSVFPGSSRPPAFGSLYISNLDGTVLKRSIEHTNRDLRSGGVDFERIGSFFYEGILLVNTVLNWEEVMNNNRAMKQLVSQMSFNNGGSWSAIDPPALDLAGKPWGCDIASTKCKLHLHSMTTMPNIGREFSPSTAPGLILGVGSVGEFLQAYQKSDVFMSEDAGKIWKHIKTGPHKYEVLDGGSILVLIPDSRKSTDGFYYSKNRGITWFRVEFKMDSVTNWNPLYTMLNSKHSSLSMLMAVLKDASHASRSIVAIDFAPTFSRQCEFDLAHPNSNIDFELFQPSSGSDSVCLMGETISYYRRKAEADCYVGTNIGNFKNNVTKTCECTKFDFQCDSNFDYDSKTKACVANSFVRDQPSECSPGSAYLGKSGYVKTPGNVCEGGINLAQPVSKTCSDHGDILKKFPIFNTTISDVILSIKYIKKTKIVIALTMGGKLWKSIDEGKSWRQFEDSNGVIILSIISHTFAHERLFFISENEVYATEDSLTSWRKMALPETYNKFGLPIFEFHSAHSDWYLYTTGGRNCDTTVCFSKVHLTMDAGKTFDLLDSWTKRCIWAASMGIVGPSKLADKDVICLSYLHKDGTVSQDKIGLSQDNPSQLVLISSDKKVSVLLSQLVVEFLVVSKILIAATIQRDDVLNLYSSVDGNVFKLAQFPPGIPSPDSYTALISPPGGVLLNVGRSTALDHEYGSLYKSNEDGTLFSSILKATNLGSNKKGTESIHLVDFERLNGIDGIFLANTVANAGIGTFETKIIESLVSFDYGASWTSIAPPILDSDELPISCHDESSCRLHFHLSADKSQPSSHGKITAGTFLGVGNFGTRLLGYEEGNLFITLDGGLNFKEIGKGPHQWAILNYGGIIVICKSFQAASSVSFSTNWGMTWTTVKFSDIPLKIHRLYTNPDSESSVAFVSAKDGAQTKLIAIDLSSSLTRSCTPKDFVTWDWENQISKDHCFLGETKTFFRRSANASCQIDAEIIPDYPATSICKCTASDYECDFDHVLQSSGRCKPLTAGTAELPCNPGKSLTSKSGFRKSSHSKCSGGVDLTLPVEITCGISMDKIKNGKNTFKAIESIFSFENSGNILLRTEEGDIYKSLNSGTTWEKVFAKIEELFKDTAIPKRAFFFAGEVDVRFTDDEGNLFKSFRVPVPRSIDMNPISTHPLHPGWLIWNGYECDDKESCYSKSFVTFDYGLTWKLFLEKAELCVWARSKQFVAVTQSTVFCLQNANEDRLGGSQFLRGDLLDTKPLEKLYTCSGFSIEDRSLVLAVPFGDKLQILISINGRDFELAKFPSEISGHTGATLLPSQNGYLYIQSVQEYSVETPNSAGTLMMSGYHTFNFSTILENVNQNSQGFVDFEIFESLNGTLLANIMSPTQVSNDKNDLTTRISWNNGLSWDALKAPPVDSLGVPYACGEGCTLNLHSYTERRDLLDTTTSDSASGFAIGVGNVGVSLSSAASGNMFISRDAGKSWFEIAKTPHLHLFANHGSVLIIASVAKIDHVKVSMDFGRSFHELLFGDGLALTVTHLLTDMSGSAKFIVVGIDDKGASVVFSSDLTSALGEECSESDFELIQIGDTCYNGEKASFYQRKIDAVCLVSPTFKKKVTCECQESDFMCDEYHYPTNQTCSPSPGINIPLPVCIAGSVLGYNGFVKKPTSVCQGGDQFGTQVIACAEGAQSGVMWQLSTWLWIILSLVLLGALTIFGLHIFNKYEGYNRFESYRETDFNSSPTSHSSGMIILLADQALDGLEFILEKVSNTGNWVRDLFVRKPAGPISLGDYHNSSTTSPPLDWGSE